MSVEMAFYTEPALPKTLQDKAVVLAGEPSWPALEALQTVDWLEANGREVVGLELWQNKEGSPLFIASSGYSPGIDDQITPESIAFCARKARLFIVRFSHEHGALFNITSAQPSAKLNGTNTASALPLYSRVRLLTDKYQSEGASCFDLGYIIEVYPDNKHEVEFSDSSGTTKAQIVVSGEELEPAPPTYDAPKRNLNAQPINAQPLKEQQK